jgi:hypothetical protein
MSSIASPVSSSSANTYFNGMSNYSASLNNEISQEVNMASLPIDLLDNDVTTLTNQSTELGTLNTDFGAVQSAISDLASAAGSTLAASVSDSSATTTLGSGATAGTYTLGVSSLGSYSDAISGAGSITVTDPTSQNISASDTFTLTVNNVAVTPPITLSGTNTNLNGLAAGHQQCRCECPSHRSRRRQQFRAGLSALAPEQSTGPGDHASDRRHITASYGDHRHRLHRRHCPLSTPSMASRLQAPPIL